MTERKFIFLHADGYHEEQATTDSISLGGLTMGGNIAMGAHKITGLLAGTDATDAVNKSQLDGMAVGLSWKDPVKVLRIKSDADQSTVVPTAGSAGEAWVVNNWTGYTDGDIVEWSGTAWVVVAANSGGEPVDGTRVIVIESGAAGSFTGHAEDIATYVAYTNTWDFVDAEDGDAVLVIGDGSYYENQGHTFDGANWIQFTGTGLITAGDGLSKTGNTLDVELYATNPGLELTGTSPNKTLAVKYDGAHGIITGASGLEIEIDDSPDTLDVGAGGLKVVGLPSLFKIDGTTVGATVTAANLDDLTDGSDASSLHRHNRSQASFTAGENVALGEPVYMTATLDTVGKADAGTDAKRWVIGLAAEAKTATNPVDVVFSGGVLAGALTGATAGVRYWLADGGGLTTTRPTGGKSVILAGIAKNATDLVVEVRDYGKGS